MEKLIKLNETPVRTSNNFGINDITVNDAEREIENFENIKISDSKCVQILDTMQKYEVKYGVGDDKVKEVFENANKKIVIHVEENMKEDIFIDFNFDDKNMNLVDNIYITLEENANAKIYLNYKSEKNLKFYHNGICKILAKKGSKLDLKIINLLDNSSEVFYSIDSDVHENARFTNTLIELGGKDNISNWYSKTSGENAKINLNSLYLGIDNQLIDLNYIGELYTPKSEINIEVQGALKDDAKKNFKGTIDFKKGSKKSVGKENESCTLLSDGARSKALPMLLCTEDDVEGEHSTASGKIQSENLFYIMSRGFTKKEAVKLIVKANFDKILENIDDDEIKNQIIHEIDKRFE